ncbi:DUF3465 domain-containing protein [Desulfoluna butyratoxydans]|uniref:DUF3465 domain-containing protein n=1 Tax=Desulfoluna butyratoxydans TaxID=231438 RepID=A0A4U8YML1_9BACT|nr:DUF3465 domain-containing protein [Desulfoluna butyratoxydans]VFQ45296.1 protein of unknown function duf3465 [Desulfoluna butyratoxydans]
MKKAVIIILIGLGAYGAFTRFNVPFSIKPILSLFTSEVSSSDEALQRAFDEKLSGIQVGGSGKVITMLPDDTRGSRHQRFIIRLDSGQTLLIAHNIDLAPRIDALRVGDHINFYGQYEWNAKGGVVHWTHHDPSGRHEDGWLNHGGKLYR